MKKILSLSISKTIAMIGLLAILINSTAPLMAQEPQNQSKRAWSNVKSYSSKAATGLSKKQKQALAALKLYSGKANRKIKKITNCLQGKDTCTKAEIRQARIYTGIIAAAITILLATGTGIAAWKQWKKQDPELDKIRKDNESPPLDDPSDIEHETYTLRKQIDFINSLNQYSDTNIKKIDWNAPVQLEGKTAVTNIGLLVADQFELLNKKVKENLKNWLLNNYDLFPPESKGIFFNIVKETREKIEEEQSRQTEEQEERIRIEEEKQERIRVKEEEQREKEKLLKEDKKRKEKQQRIEKKEHEQTNYDKKFNLAIHKKLELAMQISSEEDAQKQEVLREKANKIDDYIREAEAKSEAGDYEASINALEEALS